MESDTIPWIEGASVDFSFISQRVALPSNSGTVKIGATQDCFIKFGDSSVTADGTTSLYFAAGVEVFGIPTGATYVAVKTAGVDGIMIPFGKAVVPTERLTTNTVIAVDDASDRIILPSGTSMRLFAMADCYIKFGDGTVTATSGDTLFEAGTETIVSSGTYIAAIRVTDNGGLYISGVE